MARDFGLAKDWLNSKPASLIESGLPSGFDARMTQRDYGAALCVSFAARVDQVFLRLFAAADRNEARDLMDLKLLRPTEHELRDAARWVRSLHTPGSLDKQLARVLDHFGVTDEGRDA